jgi:hypothetical protein
MEPMVYKEMDLMFSKEMEVMLQVCVVRQIQLVDGLGSLDSSAFVLLLVSRTC